MNQYHKVMQAAFKRRGWDQYGIPTVERLKQLGIDRPFFIKIVEKARHEAVESN